MFKSSSFSLALITAALFCSSVSAQGRIDSIGSLSKCIQVRRSQFVGGTPVETWDCNTSTSQWQQWKISSGPTEVRVAAPGGCVGGEFCLAAQSVTARGNVVIQKCNKSPAQQWNLNNGLLKLANNATLCLDIPASNTTNGVQVITYPCHGGPNQQWKLV